MAFHLAASATASATAETIVLSSRAFHDWQGKVRTLPSAEAESQWFKLAVAATDGEFRLSPGEAVQARREAIANLQPRSLIELAALGPTLDLSEAYARARFTRGDSLEAAAECRDAISRYDEKASKGLRELAKRSGRPGSTAGGIAASIARVVVVHSGGPGEVDTPLQSAFGLGLRSALGNRANRVVVHFLGVQPDSGGTVSPVNAARAARDAIGTGAGVVVLPVADASLEAAMLWACQNAGLVLLASHTWTPFRRVRAPEEQSVRPWLYRLDPDPDSRAKRILQAVTSVGVHGLAVAIPLDDSPPAELANAVLDNALRLGLAPVRLDYAPGRRSYLPEAAQFARSGSDAIFLAGPGEESGDWLRALATLRKVPKVFGDGELDPAGFHESIRPLLEGSVYVAGYWQPTDSTSAFRADARSERGAPLIELELAGRELGAAIANGALSAGDLVKRFGDCADQACPMPLPASVVSVPLFRVRGGVATPIP